MEMKKLSGGNLRAAGYDAARAHARRRANAGTFEYAGVSADTYRRLVGASSPWSFFRDNIEEEYAAKRVAEAAATRAAGRPAKAPRVCDRGPLDRAGAAAGPARPYWTVSLRPAIAGFLASVSSSTPFSYFAVARRFVELDRQREAAVDAAAVALAAQHALAFLRLQFALHFGADRHLVAFDR